MSKKIVNLHGHAISSDRRVNPIEVMQGIRALWSVQLLSQNAWFLGTMVAARAQQHSVREVNLTFSEATKLTVRQGPQLFTGAVSKSKLEFIEAMQVLHFKVGMLSHINPQLLEEEDASERHFTLNPVGQFPWSDETPIYFRLPAFAGVDFERDVKAMYNDALATFPYVQPVNLRG